MPEGHRLQRRRVLRPLDGAVHLRLRELVPRHRHRGRRLHRTRDGRLHLQMSLQIATKFLQMLCRVQIVEMH